MTPAKVPLPEWLAEKLAGMNRKERRALESQLRRQGALPKVQRKRGRA